MKDWKNERLKEWKIEIMKDWKNERLKEWKIERMKDWRNERKKARKKERKKRREKAGKLHQQITQFILCQRESFTNNCEQDWFRPVSKMAPGSVEILISTIIVK